MRSYVVANKQRMKAELNRMKLRFPASRRCRGAVIGLLCTALVACDTQIVEVELITPLEQLDSVVAEQIAALVDEESGIRITLIPPPDDGTTVLEALKNGYGDLAFATNDMRHYEGIATIMPLYPSILHIATRAPDNPSTGQELLAGSTVYAGPPGSISRMLGEGIADQFETEGVDVTFVDKLDANLVDVIIVYAPIDRDRIASDPTLDGFQMVSLGDPDDIGKGSAIDRAVLLNPRLRPFIIPVGVYGDMTPEPVLTLAVDNLLVSREDLEDTVAYDVFAEILRLRPSLFSARPE